jgi:hypothetical protein
MLAAASAFSTLACGGEDLTGPRSGQLRVTTATGGTLPDPDGYLLLVDEEPPTPVGINATVTLTAPEGESIVELAGIADWCVVEGDPRRMVSVRAGGTTDVAYQVVCSAEIALTIVTATTGSEPAADAYAVRIDGGPERSIGANATLVITDLSPGAHTVELLAVPPRCQVGGANPAAVELVEGETAVVEFRVACAAEIRTWTPLAIETTADLTDVHGFSATDVFVVGERDIPGGIEGVIFRYDGAAWTRELRANDLRPRGIWGSDPSNVYAVGYGFFSTEPTILHYDGSMWGGAPGFQSGGLGAAGLESVWGSARDDVFAVGFVDDGRFDRSLIFHFDGTRWARMQVEGEVDPFLTDVWGSSGTDVYAVGRDAARSPATAVILRYDGVAWRVAVQVEGITLTAVWGSGPTDVFATGFEIIERGTSSEVRGVVWHYDGTSWSRMALPEVGVLQEIGGRSGSEVYAVGNDGVILRYDGTGWTATRPAARTLLGVWLAPDGLGFAVGNRGTLLLGE